MPTTVTDIILTRLDRIDAVLDKQNVFLEAIQKQTTLTNGRVNSLEKDVSEGRIERKEIRFALDSLSKANSVNEGVKQAIRDVQNEHKKDIRFLWTEARSLVPILISFISLFIVIYVTFFR